MSGPEKTEASSLVTDLHVQATYRLTEALVESENRMRRRIELLSEIVFETDPAGALVFLNRAWTKTLGHGVETCLGQPLSQFVLEADWPLFERVMNGGAPPPPVGQPRIRMRRGDGGIAWTEISVARLPDGGAVGALHDVTVEKHAQDEIAKLSLVASYTDNLVIITDREGRTEWVNQAFSQRTGYTLDDMRGRKPGNILQGPGTDPHVVALIRASLAEGRSFKAELLNYTRSGEPYWILLQISPIRNAQGEVERFVAIQTDCTELRRAQRELELARERAEGMATEAQAANRAKSEFLATMSHEIRTPMNGILGLTELLQQSRLDARQRELADGVASSGKALLAIINDILDLSKIEAGRMTLVAEEFELPPLVDDVVALVAQCAGGKPVSVRAEMDPALPARCRGDAGRLRQILLNLVGNGLKFTPTGSVVTRVRALGMEPGQARLRFEVADTGIGIAPATRARLFQPFQQLDSSAARRHGGTGLGLAISHRLVELMGGKMGVDSEEGRGSTFWFEIVLPVAAVPEEVPLAGLRVLVARDHPLQRRFTLLLLEKLGCRAGAVGTGREVLDRLQTEPYEVVLFEARLADMNGEALAAMIREREKAAGAGRRPVGLIALDVGGQSAEREHLAPLGVDVIRDSPLTPAVLKAALLAPVAPESLARMGASRPPAGIHRD